MATTRRARLNARQDAQPIPTEGEYIRYDFETRDFALYMDGEFCGCYAAKFDAESAARRARYAALTVATHGVSDPDLRGEEITHEEAAKAEIAEAIEQAEALGETAEAAQLTEVAVSLGAEITRLDNALWASRATLSQTLAHCEEIESKRPSNRRNAALAEAVAKFDEAKRIHDELNEQRDACLEARARANYEQTEAEGEAESDEAELAALIAQLDAELIAKLRDDGDDESAALAIDDGDDDDGPPPLVVALAEAKAHETISELLAEDRGEAFDDLWSRALERSVMAVQAAERAGIEQWDWRRNRSLVAEVRSRMQQA